jgi:cytochrome c oxidase cbb3-type subunit 3
MVKSYFQMKKIFLLSLSLLSYLGAFAQETVKEKSFWDDPFNHPLLSFYLTLSFVFIIIVLTIAVCILLIRVVSLLSRQMEKQRAEAAGIACVPELNWLEKLWQQLNASVPVAQEKEIELDHNYDGIKELDNHLPPWWKWLFYGSAIWAVGYIAVYHISYSMPLSTEEYENEVTRANEAQQKFLASQPKAAVDESNLVFTADAALIENGKAVFTKNACGSCHRNDGGGNSIGPNLTDEYWIHGGGIKNVFHTINTGVVEKGMPAWGKSMSATDVRDVAFFVMSLQGTKPANAKAPQGELYKPEPKADRSDSTKTTALK